MRRVKVCKTWLVGALMSAGGCGAFPEVIVEAAKDSAKEALLQAVDDVVDEVIGNSVGEWLDFPGLGSEDLSDEENGAIDDTEEAEDDPEEQDEENMDGSGGRR